MITAGHYTRTPDGIAKVLTTNAGLGPPEHATTATVTLYTGGPQLTPVGVRTYTIGELTDLGPSPIRAKLELLAWRYRLAAGGPPVEGEELTLLDELLDDLATLARDLR